MWDWSYTFEILPKLMRAAIVTIEATLLGFVIAATPVTIPNASRIFIYRLRMCVSKPLSR